VDTSKDDIATTLGNENCDNNYTLVNSSREAIDLIGAFRNYPNGSSEGIDEFDSLPQLDLSLKRSHSSAFRNEYTEERRTLGHSNASAFTR
jgi:pseudo-response regulator 5